MHATRILPIVLLLIAFAFLPHITSAAAMLQPIPLGELTAQLYSYALKVAGLAVFIMFILAGLAYMVPAIQSKVGKPVQMIQDAVIGLIILASAFVILNSIHGDLVTGGSTSTTTTGN
jgi:hypothetical protein